MLRFLIILGLSSSLFSQTISFTGPTSVKQGRTFDLNINLNGVASNGPAAIQWTLGIPSGLALGTTNTSIPNKTAACSSGSSPICIIYGINQTGITTGNLAVSTLSVPISTTTGTKTFTLSGIVAVKSDGTPFILTAGGPYNISVTAIADIDNSGVINASDVSLMANQVISGTCTDDQNNDNVCNIIDVYIVVLRALGV